MNSHRLLQTSMICVKTAIVRGNVFCNFMPPYWRARSAGIVPKANNDMLKAASYMLGAVVAAIIADTIKPQGINPKIMPRKNWLVKPLFAEIFVSKLLTVLYGSVTCMRDIQGKNDPIFGKAIAKNIKPALASMGAMIKLRIGKNKNARFKTE